MVDRPHPLMRPTHRLRPGPVDDGECWTKARKGFRKSVALFRSAQLGMARTLVSFNTLAAPRLLFQASLVDPPVVVHREFEAASQKVVAAPR